MEAVGAVAEAGEAAAVAYPEEEAQVAGGEFLSAAEENALVEAIQAAEAKTTGEIRVHLARKTSRHGILADAANAFEKLGMHKTAKRNGVLIYIAVESHEAACLGDQGIHAFVGQTGWEKTIAALTQAFAQGNALAGLKDAIHSIAQILAKHFPPEGTETENELPDDISKS